MSAAYSSSVKKHLPNVSIIFDPFHVAKLLNDTIDKIRRAEYAKCQNKGLRVYKGQRFLLLRNFVDLEDVQKNSLQKLLEINQSLARAQYERTISIVLGFQIEKRRGSLSWLVDHTSH